MKSVDKDRLQKGAFDIKNALIIMALAVVIYLVYCFIPLLGDYINVRSAVEKGAAKAAVEWDNNRVIKKVEVLTRGKLSQPMPQDMKKLRKWAKKHITIKRNKKDMQVFFKMKYTMWITVRFFKWVWMKSYVLDRETTTQLLTTS